MIPFQSERSQSQKASEPAGIRHKVPILDQAHFKTTRRGVAVENGLLFGSKNLSTGTWVKPASLDLDTDHGRLGLKNLIVVLNKLFQWFGLIC